MPKDTDKNMKRHQLPLFEFDEANLAKLKNHPANENAEESDFGKYIVFRASTKTTQYLFWHFVFFTSVTTAKQSFLRLKNSSSIILDTIRSFCMSMKYASV